MAMNINDLFLTGMKRQLPELLDNYGVQVELGSGNNPVDGAIGFDIDKWDGNEDATLPFENDSVDVVHAYHFLEHLDTPVHVLFECQRILRIGGHMNIVVPYYSSQLQFSCWEHKSFFSEEVWQQTFEKNCNKFGYKWQFNIGLNVIIGIVEKNMCLMTQLIKATKPNKYIGYTK